MSMPSSSVMRSESCPPARADERVVEIEQDGIHAVKDRGGVGDEKGFADPAPEDAQPS